MYEYETPILLDLQEVAATVPECCDTGGGTCGPELVQG
jgi:hypothetical protein